MLDQKRGREWIDFLFDYVLDTLIGRDLLIFIRTGWSYHARGRQLLQNALKSNPIPGAYVIPLSIL